MRGSYAKAAAAMPPGLEAADYVVILLDWDGKVSHAYGAHKIERRPRLVLLDHTGIVRGVHQAEEIRARRPGPGRGPARPPGAGAGCPLTRLTPLPEPPSFMQAILTRLYSKERFVIVAIALAGLALRLWALGAKGLAYDEAATALMARASGPDRPVSLARRL